MSIRRALFFLALTGALVSAGPQWATTARAGSISYEVKVDTSSLAGTSGGLEFTFAAGNTPAPLDTSTITMFTSDGVLAPPPPTTSGDVLGVLPATMSMDNQNPSLYFQPFTYRTFIDYIVTLTSTAGNPSSADTLFAFYLFDQNGNPVSGPGSPSGEVLDINIEGPSGAVDPPVTYPPPSITVTPLNAVPEPSSIVLLGVGLGAILVRARRRRS
jgi:hypothetical protein